MINTFIKKYKTKAIEIYCYYLDCTNNFALLKFQPYTKIRGPNILSPLILMISFTDYKS